MRIRNLLSIIFLISTLYSLKGQGYQIHIKIEGLKDTSLILGHYFEKKILVNDTIVLNDKGAGSYKGDEKLPEGIYVIYLPDKSYFDILIGKDQNINVQTPGHDFIEKMKLSGSTESQNFLKHQRFLNEKQKAATELQEKLKTIKNNSDSTKLVQGQLQSIHDEVMAHWEKAIDENKGTFLAAFLKSLEDIKIPDIKVGDDVANKDSVVQVRKYYYYRDHYFDNIDLTDERLLRTPILANKVESFFKNTVVQVPDTLAKEAINLIEKCRPNPETFKFMIQYLFNYAVESKMMGMDAMVVAIGEKYYLSGEATWADEKFLKDLDERVRLIKPNLIGKTAHDLKLESVTGEYFRLSEVIAPYTIVVFWEPTCGHCKKEIPVLKEKVWEPYKSKGIKIFAVYTQTEKPEWEKFIEEHDLFEWMNLYDPMRQSHFREYYDISSTPIVYILDKNKKIVAKRIGVEDIPGFFEHEIKFGHL